MANEQNLKPFKKGHKLATGRPKGSKNLSTTLADMLMQQWPTKKDGLKPVTELVVMGIIRKAMFGDVAAFREIMDRTEGKVVQPVKSDSTLDLRAIDLSTMTTEQIQEYLERHKEGI